MKAWPLVGIALMQALLLAAHWFLYHTWIRFWGPLSPPAAFELRAALLALGFSFVAAALLGFYSASRPVTLLYRLAAVWLGFLNFFFWAACLCWLTALGFRVAAAPLNRPLTAVVLFGLAAGAGLYGIGNAYWIQTRRIAIELPGLPASWRGRTALVVSDLHLGHVNGPGFSRRIVRMAARLKPDVILIPGDLFDGARFDASILAAPLVQLAPPLGVYFSSGNHDEFGDTAHYAEVLQQIGIRALNNEKVNVDGLEIAGVRYGDSGSPIQLRAILEGLRLTPGGASILLNHVPNRLPIVEEAGLSLLLSGHTHGGQIFPFTWLTRRAFGKFTYGLQCFGALQVYTSSGAGTWGPPMRVGTRPEIVLLRFE